MGNTRSSDQTQEIEETDTWWHQTQSVTQQHISQDQFKLATPPRSQQAQTKLDEFKLDLARKHEKRRQLIAQKKEEMQQLREEVQRLRLENEALKRDGAIETVRTSNQELKETVAGLQREVRRLGEEAEAFEREREEYRAHVVALKDVVSVSKQMLLIREAQLKELKEKIGEIESALAGRETALMAQDLRAEYEKELQKIRSLKAVYEERQRADWKEKEEIRRVLDEVKIELEQEKSKKIELEANIERLEQENSNKYDEIKSLESTLGLTRAECRQYQAELAVINQLFSQILLGFNTGQEIDFDKLTKLLEENHHLLQDIAINEDSNQVSALPKVLLGLVNEVSEEEPPKPRPEAPHQLNSPSEIVENLPKVWKVLIELLSHQSAPLPCDKDENPCYKAVETPKGTHLVLSVSQTFIRLKDLILEKKSLERETCRLKQLNTHLECRLQEQEKRLEMVSSELSETWHVVGKLQKKHQLLHTQEKILRYELAQKRKLLTELKEELEYSREKWQEAREKNSNTEKQWEQLRIEFASRKSAVGDDYNNSVESGYSDDKECSSEDEPGYETDVSDCNHKASSETVGEGKVDPVLSEREERLARLENQASCLVKQVTSTNNRSEAISSQLDALHDAYGEGGSGEGAGPE